MIRERGVRSNGGGSPLEDLQQDGSSAFVLDRFGEAGSRDWLDFWKGGLVIPPRSSFCSICYLNPLLDRGRRVAAAAAAAPGCSYAVDQGSRVEYAAASSQVG